LFSQKKEWTMAVNGLRSRWSILGVTIMVGLAATLAGCASVGPVTEVSVPDVKSVTGTWQGIVYRSGVEPEHVMLTIREDGTYDVVSADKVGASRGSGKVVISGGRLVIEGERGRGVGTLLRNPAGDLVMNVDATLSDNSTLSAKLWPSR
jgi:hypothetical protein